MYETAEDLAVLQRLLDDSYAAAGPHLRSVITPERRLDAAGVVRRLQRVQVLHLATVTAKGEPRVGPVDGLFYRGHFWFGSADNAVRMRHIRARPQVSGTVSQGEGLAVTVHGRAVEVDLNSAEGRPFRDLLLEVYGPGWSDWGGTAPYARIDATRMFTFHMPAAEPASAPDAASAS